MTIDSSAINGVHVPGASTDVGLAVPLQHSGRGKPANRVDAPVVAPVESTKDGETPATRKLREQLAEKKIITSLQDDTAWTEADTPRVIGERAKAAEAHKLHHLQRDPARRALSAARWRKRLTIAVGTGLVAALGWSTANVQHTVAAGAEVWSGRWMLAYLVEPFLGLFVLTIFAFLAYMATQGEVVEDSRIKRAHRTFLGFTLLLNVWTHVPWLAEQRNLLALVVAVIGPISAVLAVQTVPVMWAYIGDLDHGGPAADPELVEHLGAVRHLIAIGEVAETPSRAAMAKALRARGHKINDQMAQRVHRCLTGRTELL